MTVDGECRHNQDGGRTRCRIKMADDDDIT